MSATGIQSMGLAGKWKEMEGLTMEEEPEQEY